MSHEKKQPLPAESKVSELKRSIEHRLAQLTQQAAEKARAPRRDGFEDE